MSEYLKGDLQGQLSESDEEHTDWSSPVDGVETEDAMADQKNMQPTAHKADSRRITPLLQGVGFAKRSCMSLDTEEYFGSKRPKMNDTVSESPEHDHECGNFTTLKKKQCISLTEWQLEYKETGKTHFDTPPKSTDKAPNNSGSDDHKGKEGGDNKTPMRLCVDAAAELPEDAKDDYLYPNQLSCPRVRHMYDAEFNC